MKVVRDIFRAIAIAIIIVGVCWKSAPRAVQLFGIVYVILFAVVDKLMFRSQASKIAELSSESTVRTCFVECGTDLHAKLTMSSFSDSIQATITNERDQVLNRFGRHTLYDNSEKALLKTKRKFGILTAKYDIKRISGMMLAELSESNSVLKVRDARGGPVFNVERVAGLTLRAVCKPDGRLVAHIHEMSSPAFGLGFAKFRVEFKCDLEQWEVNVIYLAIITQYFEFTRSNGTLGT